MPTPSGEPFAPTEAVREVPEAARAEAESRTPERSWLGGPSPGSPSPPRPRAAGKPLSAAELAARRANLAKAHAADKDLIYRSTARRRAASRRNIQRGIAWRRSPEGNAVARLNAFKHGLAVKTLPELLRRLGEAPEDFAEHREHVRRVFRPESVSELGLVERLARATWRHIRIFRAQARLEASGWRRLLARAGQAQRLTLEEFSNRACDVSKLFAEARLVEDEAYKLEQRIERILESLIRERARNEGAR